MKLKKKTSMMLVASAVVAVTGIAAVSFAAWQGNANTSLTADAATGSVQYFGFEANANTEQNYTSTPLFPYNQEGDLGTGVTVINVEIPVIEYNDNFVINISYEATTDLTLKYSYDINATVPVDKTTPVETDWKDIKREAKKLDEVTDADLNVKKTTKKKYVHIALVSNSEADMNKNFTIKVELVK